MTEQQKATQRRKEWGRILECGCALGYERCFDCRAGLDLDQEKALAISMAETE